MDNQREVEEYVRKHVHWCLSELVSEVAPKVQEGHFENYDGEEAYALFHIDPDISDCEDQGFKFVERDDLWYYSDQDMDPEVLGTFTVEEVVEFAEDKCLLSGYDEDNDNPHDYLQDALEAMADENITHRLMGGKYELTQLFNFGDLELFMSEDEAVRDCIETNDITAPEVYEHWLVDDHLAYMLRKHGETVVDDFFGLQVWCRTTTGQSISMDYVICQIFKEVNRDE